MKDKQKVISTITKLMALAMDDGATPAEREVAMEKAKHIMLKYNIEQAEVLTKEKVETNGADRVDSQMFTGDLWESYLAASIAQLFDCQTVRPYTKTHMYFFGMKDDLEITIDLYGRLLRYISSMGRKAYPRKQGVVLKIRSYCTGVQVKVCSRLGGLYKRVKEELPSECRALVVVKEEAIDRKILNDIGKTSTRNYRPSIDRDAFSRGMRDGDSVPLHSNHDRVRNST